MSHRESRRQHRDDRHLCAACRERKAKYRYRGRVRADRSHVLCFQCFRSARERMRAQQLATLPFDVAEESLRVSARLGISAPSASPLAAQVEHRRRMLTYLESQAARCAR